MAIETLKRRAEFLRIRGGARWSGPSCLIEGKRRPSIAADPASPDVTGPDVTAAPIRQDGPARFGLTITKKLGNAVVRNRIRRRLRAVLTALAPAHGLPGCDYVVVARDACLRRPHAALTADITAALAHVNKRLAHPARQR